MRSAANSEKDCVTIATESLVHSPRARGAGFRKLLARPGQLVSKQHFLGLADQAFVSATSFLTLVIFARATSAETTGYFALAISVAAAAVALQHAMVSQPYVFASSGTDGLRQDRASCCLVLAGASWAAMMVLFLAAAVTLPVLGGSEAAVLTALALIGFVPAVLAKELVRNFALAHLRLRNALSLDVAACLLQLAGLAYLAAFSEVTLLAGLAVIGAVSFAVSAAALYVTRAEFSWSGVPIRGLLAQSWSSGKWFTASRLAHLIQGYATLWLTALIDLRMTAVLAACLSVVGLASPIVQGLYNVLAPQAVLAWRNQGAEGLLRKGLHDLAVLAAVMTAFSIVLVLGAESAVQLLYPAPEYSGYGQVVYILAFATSAAALGIPASNGLAAMGNARAAAAITVATSLLHCVLVALAMSRYGLLGAAYATLVSSVVWTTARWMAFLRLGRRQRQLSN